jgi:glycosyltransferase involved in cell wall biosynthesis
MKTLFIVEKNFLNNHVGVRRVTRHLMNVAISNGHEIDIAYPQAGHLIVGELSISKSKHNKTRTSHTSANTTRALELLNHDADAEPKVTWHNSTADHGSYASTIITNPWLCSDGLPKIKNAYGVVHDLVPNMLALNSLRFERHIDIYGFAHEHSIGYEYYRSVCEKLISVSQSTKRDFLNLYPSTREDKILIHTPFKSSAPQIEHIERDGILLVNVLDWRKNFKRISTVLNRAQNIIKGTKITIVGQERIPPETAQDFMMNLSSMGYDVTWHRDASDKLLGDLYRKSALLFFPSLYEGLGLPVLEAQDQGLPTLTTDIASLKDINMNKNLCIPENDEEKFVDQIIEIIKKVNKDNIITGASLNRLLHQYIEQNTDQIF